MTDTPESLRAAQVDMLEKARLMDEDEIGGPTARRIRDWAEALASALTRLEAKDLPVSDEMLMTENAQLQERVEAAERDVVRFEGMMDVARRKGWATAWAGQVKSLEERARADEQLISAIESGLFVDWSQIVANHLPERVLEGAVLPSGRIVVLVGAPPNVESLWFEKDMTSPKGTKVISWATPARSPEEA